MSPGSSKDFQYLGGATARKTYAPNGDFRCFVEGVKCSHCLQRIESAFLTHPEVRSVRMDMGQSILSFQISEQAQLPELAQTVEGLGFPTTPLKVDQDHELAQKQASRRSLYKIGVAGVAAGNIMLLSVSLYSGADQTEFRNYFEWVSALLFLPVFFYSALPFYKIAWADIAKRQISIDLPIVMAIIGGTILSFYHLAFTGGDIYFDSLAVLVFLLLSSRHFLAELQKKFLNPKYLHSFLNTSQALVKTPNGWESRPVEDLKSEDIIQLKYGEQLPADGRLLEEGGFLNTSVLTGESLPEKVGPRQNVFAGTTWMSGPVSMQVQKIGDNTRMGRIFQQMEAELMRKTPLLTLTDRVAKYFTLAILSISAIFLASYLWVDSEEAIRRSLALIILACPCALALATPLTQSLGLMKSAKLGAIIKNAGALEALFQIKNVVFDKTGTLTTGQLRLTSIGRNLMTKTDEKALLALESLSCHPVAYCLLDYFGRDAQDSLPEVLDHRRLKSGGISGTVFDHQYSARKSSTQEPNAFGPSVDFFRDEELIAQFQFADAVRSSSLETCQRLGQMGLPIHLLTGDLPAPSQHVAQTLGIPENHVYASQSPEQKQQVIKSLPHAMMVGDGVNDSVALAAADVGVSVHGSMKNSLAASDIYLTTAGVQRIPDLLTLATETRKVIVRNLTISVFYNLIFGILALVGYVNPLVAAILMPLSSLTVVISAVLGTSRMRMLDKLQKTQNNTDTTNKPRELSTVVAS